MSSGRFTLRADMRAKYSSDSSVAIVPDACVSVGHGNSFIGDSSKLVSDGSLL